VTWRFVRLRGTRAVTCPETKKTVAVEVNTARAAITAAFGRPRFDLTECSRWPERRDCGRECLSQIEDAPMNCLVRTKLAAWYEGRSCVACGKPFGDIYWVTHRPASMAPDGTMLAWREVKAEQLAEVTEEHAPVCWDCYVHETFRRQHPELVIDNPWKKAGPPA
jgi:hypothetical protein